MSEFKNGYSVPAGLAGTAAAAVVGAVVGVCFAVFGSDGNGFAAVFSFLVVVIFALTAVVSFLAGCGAYRVCDALGAARVLRSVLSILAATVVVTALAAVPMLIPGISVNWGLPALSAVITIFVSAGFLICFERFNKRAALGNA